MKRLALALLVGLLVLALPGVAGAKKKQDDVDFTKGKGETAFPNPILNPDGSVTVVTFIQKFNFKAKDLDADPVTDAAKGKLSYERGTRDSNGSTSSSSKLKAEVTCLRVAGDSAVFLAQVKKSSDPNIQEGDTIQVDVFAQSQPDEPPDLFQLREVPPSTPCPAPDGFGAPLDKGNIVVNDAV